MPTPSLAGSAIINTAPLPAIDTPRLSELSITSGILMFGLNFQHTQVIKSGLINKFKKNTQDMDLDLSCMLLDDQFEVIETVWFKQLRDAAYAVRHHGDSLDGNDRSDIARVDPRVDVETIEVRLARLPRTVKHLAFMVSSYHGHALKRIKRGNITFGDDEGNLLCEVDLTQNIDAATLCAAVLSREYDDWRCYLQPMPIDAYLLDDLKVAVKQRFFHTPTSHATSIVNPT